MQSPHVSIVAAAASQSDALEKDAPLSQSAGAPAHWFGYAVDSAVQKPKPMLAGAPRHAVHAENAGVVAIAWHVASVDADVPPAHAAPGATHVLSAAAAPFEQNVKPVPGLLATHDWHVTRDGACSTPSSCVPAAAVYTAASVVEIAAAFMR